MFCGTSVFLSLALLIWLSSWNLPLLSTHFSNCYHIFWYWHAIPNKNSVQWHDRSIAPELVYFLAVYSAVGTFVTVRGFGKRLMSLKFEVILHPPDIVATQTTFSSPHDRLTCRVIFNTRFWIQCGVFCWIGISIFCRTLYLACSWTLNTQHFQPILCRIYKRRQTSGILWCVFETTWSR